MLNRSASNVSDIIKFATRQSEIMASKSAQLIYQ